MSHPVTPTETVVATVLCELLGVDSVDTTEDFFALGGHSMLAVQAVQELAERTKVPLELAAFFDLSTVRDVAAEVDRLRSLQDRREVPVVDEGEL